MAAPSSQENKEQGIAQPQEQSQENREQGISRRKLLRYAILFTAGIGLGSMLNYFIGSSSNSKSSRLDEIITNTRNPNNTKGFSDKLTQTVTIYNNCNCNIDLNNINMAEKRNNLTITNIVSGKTNNENSVGKIKEEYRKAVVYGKINSIETVSDMNTGGYYLIMNGGLKSEIYNNGGLEKILTMKIIKLSYDHDKDKRNIQNILNISKYLNKRGINMYVFVASGKALLDLNNQNIYILDPETQMFYVGTNDQNVFNKDRSIYIITLEKSPEVLAQDGKTYKDILWAYDKGKGMSVGIVIEDKETYNKLKEAVELANDVYNIIGIKPKNPLNPGEEGIVLPFVTGNTEVLGYTKEGIPIVKIKDLGVGITFVTKGFYDGNYSYLNDFYTRKR